jgi:hypothetical protein
MGQYTMGPPEELVKSLMAQFSLKTFVETGTLFGGTAIWAAGHFERVYTIEASEKLHGDAQEKFADFDNIISLFGSTGYHLHKLLPELEPSIFFLDAHWSGGDTAGGNFECPLLTELAIIMPWFRKHIILVDDARLFLKPPPPPHVISEWPSLDQIALSTMGLAYIACYKDVLLLAPSQYKSELSSLLQVL